MANENKKFIIPTTIAEACRINKSASAQRYNKHRELERELKRVSGGPYSELALALAELEALNVE